MGNKLVVSFANPAKHYDTHDIRPQKKGRRTPVVAATVYNI